MTCSGQLKGTLHGFEIPYTFGIRRRAHRHGVRGQDRAHLGRAFRDESTNNLVTEACLRRLRGLTTLTRDEMRLAGYTDEVPAIDVCAGNRVNGIRRMRLSAPGRRKFPASFFAVHESAAGQVFGRRQCRASHALMPSASEKCQGTKSRGVGHRLPASTMEISRLHRSRWQARRQHGASACRHAGQPSSGGLKGGNPDRKTVPQLLRLGMNVAQEGI
jgi:hypothetical protein